MSVLNFSQIAYLENLLKVYNEEICCLQQAELSLDDLGTEESSYIQEHKLKRKVRLEFDASLVINSAESCKKKRKNHFSRLCNPQSHLFLLSSSSLPDDEDLWKAVWTKGLRHTNRPSHWAEDHLQQHSISRDQQEGELVVVGLNSFISVLESSKQSKTCLLLVWMGRWNLELAWMPLLLLLAGFYATINLFNLGFQNVYSTIQNTKWQNLKIDLN